MEVKYDNDNLWDYLISCEDAYTVISYYGGCTSFIPYVKSSTMVHGTSYPLIKRELGVEVTTTQTWFDLYYLSGDPRYEHIFIPASQGVFGLADVASSVTADIGRWVDYTPVTNISPSNTAILYDVYNYFNSTPTVYSIAVRCSANFAYYGQQPATLQITINYTGTLTKDCTYYTNTNGFGVCLYKASELTIQGSSFTITPDNSEIAPVSGSLGNGYQPPNYDYWEFGYPYSLFSVVANVSTTDANKYSDINNYFLNPPVPTGEGSAVINISINGENLTFESAHYGTAKTQFINSNTTIDMRPN